MYRKEKEQEKRNERRYRINGIFSGKNYRCAGTLRLVLGTSVQENVNLIGKF